LERFVQVASVLLAFSRSPEWIAKTDSAGFIARIILSFEGGTHPDVSYYVAPDGAVKRPEIATMRENVSLQLNEIKEKIFWR